MDALSIEVRPAGLGDVDALVELHRACWVEAYTDLMPPGAVDRVFADPERLRRRRVEQIADPARTMLLAVVDDALVGFAASGPPRHDDPPAPLELYAVYARAATWGRGVGPALLAAAVGARPAYLWVLEGNDRAVAFYRRHRFAPDGATDERPEGRVLRMTRR
ncbi:hypothetical protein GCM10023340_13520 [Nocardioides marinquilinus]|uniref:N-acetyltransferase domain-containing protein n=1 Tax=Nocardioides marinquilinus TaxID=1210400 RepID=A0ABP9PHF5_9ACTN